MSIPSSRAFSLLSLVVVLALFSVSCGRASDESSSAPAAEVTPMDLLPPPTSGTPSTETSGSPTAVPTTPPVDVAVTSAPTAIETPSVVSCLSVRARIGQLLLPLVTQSELEAAQSYAAAGDIGGVGLLGEPDAGLVAALEALQQTSVVPLMIASDEEGGSVQRLAKLLGPIPSAAATAQSKTPEDVRKQWLEYGERVRALGIDVIFGPVVDVGAGPGIESRSFGDDPAVVTAYGRAVADGLLEAGVTPVLKHFPGHGRATADSHLVLPTTPPLSELRTYDLVPYIEILSEPRYAQQVAVMIGHLSVPGLSDETPTSLSPATVNGLLREELGFDGLVFTDALNMGAIDATYGRLEALELALLAGSDIAILGSLADIGPAVEHLVQRVAEDAELSAVIDNRATRVLIAKGQGELCAGAG